MQGSQTIDFKSNEEEKIVTEDSALKKKNKKKKKKKLTLNAMLDTYISFYHKLLNAAHLHKDDQIVELFDQLEIVESSILNILPTETKKDLSPLARIYPYLAYLASNSIIEEICATHPLSFIDLITLTAYAISDHSYPDDVINDEDLFEERGELNEFLYPQLAKTSPLNSELIKHASLDTYLRTERQKLRALLIPYIFDHLKKGVSSQDFTLSLDIITHNQDQYLLEQIIEHLDTLHKKSEFAAISAMYKALLQQKIALAIEAAPKAELKLFLILFEKIKFDFNFTYQYSAANKTIDHPIILLINPLHHAILKKNNEDFSLLLPKMLDINKPIAMVSEEKSRRHIPSTDPLFCLADAELTPLHLAAQLGRKLMTKKLINSKANLNSVTAQGNTALMLAALHWHNNTYIIMEKLIAAEADLFVKNLAGQTAREIAITGKNKDIPRLLTKAELQYKQRSNTPPAALEISLDEIHIRLIQISKLCQTFFSEQKLENFAQYLEYLGARFANNTIIISANKFFATIKNKKRISGVPHEFAIQPQDLNLIFDNKQLSHGIYALLTQQYDPNNMIEISEKKAEYAPPATMPTRRPSPVLLPTVEIVEPVKLYKPTKRINKNEEKADDIKAIIEQRSHLIQNKMAKRLEKAKAKTARKQANQYSPPVSSLGADEKNLPDLVPAEVQPLKNDFYKLFPRLNTAGEIESTSLTSAHFLFFTPTQALTREEELAGEPDLVEDRGHALRA